ncbi:sugar ABC transporter ATP-binding protein [Actinotalea sp. K2]|uniref:sugar ABC transporter ATP-binding protein n=1 Tax=Actinotalea sp. K2 TaxID=2939438 RepID=UPI0020178D1B|nr:sugar ABC transporter ATP-binding protein [Actinotalea sp. K2]MCL3859815.1 sugar ABC transporter ATP-binding protein [Actinotalea sp. K2]
MSVDVAGPALRVQGLTKRYPGVTALDGVDLEVHAGQVLSLSGANGAGKSTLVKILSGAEQPDAGHIWVDGTEVHFDSPHAARRSGIYTIYQEMSLVPTMSVVENIFLDDFAKGVFVRRGRLEKRAFELMERLGAPVDVRIPVGSLPLAKQQLVEIAKALKSDPHVLLLDEPTTTLPPRDVGGLLDLMRALAVSGVGLIFISHRLDEVTQVCDTVDVLRDGRRVAHFDTVPGAHQIVKEMVGDRYENSLAAAAAEGAEGKLGGVATDDVVLQVHELSDGHQLHPVSFDLRRGEVLGITGLLGAGQNELAECLFGLREVVSGSSTIDGRKVRVRSPQEAIRAGLGLIPEDRKSQGLVLDMSANKNITLASLASFTRVGLLDHRHEVRHALTQVDELSIKCSSVHQHVRTMSGGNQQKVLLARWLTKNSKVLILAEPTRGVDVAAKEEIYRLIRAYLRAGGAAIVVTSEVSEAALCDRVMVLSSGRVVAEATHEEISSKHQDLLTHLR